ncbi:uncharacterized protein M421DRAFT_426569 [Didymella exigua CBS 183.55]|uniref:Uncharacterized protein n=1 Tax=Didymella exigua CBS 183.55 TaxID=1150837 RepID=A0A6A5R6C3_9PLEO|nr:uncharacterized protein M421DRAFT_426569 [Didymella exigua CBS 183.55]KAF1922738.1 hypothetical protein M421DRAFT_426569 [Didymella exigua CBS 183.55]
MRDSNADMMTQLGVCLAAQALDMDKYVDYFIHRVDAIFHSLPSYEDLNTLVVQKDLYPRMYAIVVRSFARKTREGKIPDQTDFDQYLKSRSDFAQDIEEALTKNNSWVESQAKYEQHVKIENEAKAKAIELDKLEKERAVRKKQSWNAKKTNDTKMRKSTEAKSRASGNARKFTPEERAWYVKVQGKQPPKGR